MPLREVCALLGLPRFSPARLAFAFALAIVAIGLAIAGLVGLFEALHLYLLRHLSPPVAKLAVALLLLVVAGVLCLIAQRLVRPLPPQTKRMTAASGGSSAETDEALAWVRRNPGQSAVLAAVLGFCFGALPEARKAMSEFVKPRR